MESVPSNVQYHTLRFTMLLVPYVVFVVAGAVLGAAFVTPTVIFDVLGETGLLVVVLAVGGSAAAIFRTETTLVDLGEKLNNQQHE